MNKYLIIIVLLTSFLFGLSDDIPYDWSGQYGVISNGGRVMWNQDWFVGVLLFDGTFANYTTRFGTSYKNNYSLNKTGDIYSKLYSLPDSSQIKSKIDYYRGDFSYDQLEIVTEFADKNRLISLNGFKRTYNGPYGQYSNPNGSNNPLSQSYRLDYSSRDKDELLDISFGYFNTDSRLNLNDPADFNHGEKIISTGIGYSNDFAAWQYKVHGAMFQQYYSMDLSSTKVYLNRFHLNHLIGKKIGESNILKFGVTVDNQGISLVDTTMKNRLWSTIYGGWSKKYLDFKFGAVVTKNEMVPFFNVMANSNTDSRIKWQTDLNYEIIPKHIVFWNESMTKLFEKWLTFHFDVEPTWKKIPINISIDYFNFKSDDSIYGANAEIIDISNNLLSSSVKTCIPIFRDWKIDASYRHTFEHNYYSDGIGDRIKLGIIVNENFFKDNLNAQFKFWGDAYLNRNPNLEFQGFHYGPHYIYDTASAIPDYWVFNLTISAKISSMTIGWKVNNVLKTAESITQQLLPNLNDKYLLITNSNNFPPMNRFVTFYIIWDFEN